MLNSNDMAKLLNGTWITNPDKNWAPADFSVSGTPADLKKNAVFIAIAEKEWLAGTGNRGHYAHWKDTHAQLPQLSRNYTAAIVQNVDSTIRNALHPQFPLLQVPNSYDVIRRLAEFGRRQIRGPVIAVTGTVGKSSVRLMLNHVLEENFDVVGTRGNHNSRTGVALTLGRCVTKPYIAVVEVALSALWMRDGGIGPLMRPNIAIITEIGVGQSSPEDAAIFKSRICNGLEQNGIAILNRDMDYYNVCKREVERFGARVLSYGFHEAADCRVTQYTPSFRSSGFTVSFNGKEYRSELKRPGKGMVRNALAVLVSASLVGSKIEDVLESLATFELPERLVSIDSPLASGGMFTLINDSYNAEMLSMNSALEVLGNYQRTGRRKIAVLGRIINLGKNTKEIHAELLSSILSNNIDKVYLHGDELSRLHEILPASVHSEYFGNATKLVDSLGRFLKSDDVILVKGDVRDSDFGSIPQMITKRAISG